mgnify:FL=1
MAKAKYMNGTNGKAWYNGELISRLTSIELKLTAKTDDINTCGEMETDTAILGYSTSGTLKLNKWADDVTAEMMENVFKCITTGVPDDAKVIIALEDPSTGKAERYAINDIVFTEISIKCEPKKIIEQEFPFKAGKCELLETMAS